MACVSKRRRFFDEANPLATSQKLTDFLIEGGISHIKHGFTKVATLSPLSLIVPTAKVSEQPFAAGDWGRNCVRQVYTQDYSNELAVKNRAV
jgi:hypothetical protein